MKPFIFYLGGSVVWLLLLALMPAADSLTNSLIVNYITLSAGFACGFLGKEGIKKRPWLLLFVPGLPLILGIFL